MGLLFGMQSCFNILNVGRDPSLKGELFVLYLALMLEEH